MAIRGYFTSPFHDEPWIESHLDIRDRDGNHLPGYGWIFPVGDGTVNVGVGLLSTFTGLEERQYLPPDGRVLRDRARPLGHLARDRDLRPDRRPAPDRRIGDARGSGPTFWWSATRPASVNPFNGEGISLAYETGRLAADAVDLALTTGDGLALADVLPTPRRGVRPLLQGRPHVRARDRQPGGDARADPRRHAAAAR